MTEKAQAGQQRAVQADQQGGAGQQRQGGAQEAAGGRVVHLPDVRIPDVRMPHMRVPVPGGAGGRVLWWGGLAGVAALGVVDWPVAALVGAGTWVAEQYAKAAAQGTGPGGARPEVRHETGQEARGETG
jgi:hypothetical protein